MEKIATKSDAHNHTMRAHTHARAHAHACIHTCEHTQRNNTYSTHNANLPLVVVVVLSWLPLVGPGTV